MKHSDGYNRKCTTPGTLSENWGTSSQGKVGKVESRQGWKWARLKAGKGESEQEKFEPKTVSPSLIMLAHFFWFLFTPHLGSRTKCDLGNPNNRLAITDSQLHALGANKMWTLGAKKLSLSDYKTFLCFFSLTLFDFKPNSELRCWTRYYCLLSLIHLICFNIVILIFTTI